jgi:hypothetical protein
MRSNATAGRAPAFVRGLLCLGLAGFLTASGTGLASAQALAPYKDRLFAYPKVLEQSADGAFLRLDYQERRDINGRDDIPERRARRQFVSTGVNRNQRERTLNGAAGPVELYEIGAAGNARFAVIFVHGRGGDRRLGADDWSFGGNFNRLKNLANDNGGTYYVPSFPSFDAGGMAALRTVVEHIRAVSPGAPVVIACGSMGSLLCFEAANDAAIGAVLEGLLILGGPPNSALAASRAVSNGVPIVFGHGSRDSVYAWEQQRAVFEQIRVRRPTYPARFVLFESGTHGTPIRMIDWRDSLNFILAN